MTKSKVDYGTSSARVASIATAIFAVFIIVYRIATARIGPPAMIFDFIVTWLVFWIPLFLISKAYRRFTLNPRFEIVGLVIGFWFVLGVLGALLVLVGFVARTIASLGR